MIVYSTKERQNPHNKIYNLKVDIQSFEDLERVAQYDWINGEMKDYSRSKVNFIQADSITLDFDNDYSEVSSEWVTESTIQERLPNVKYGIVYSKSNNIEKVSGNKRFSPRPRMHVIIETGLIKSTDEYESITHKMLKLFPEADGKALDASHLFYGVENPKVFLADGTICLKDFIDDNPNIFSDRETDSQKETIISHDTDNKTPIPVGERNTTIFNLSSKYAYRNGTDNLNDYIQKQNSRCEEPLEQRELDGIEKSVRSYYDDIVSSYPDYIKPKDYNILTGKDSLFYKPDIYSDLGFAEILNREYKDKMLYTDGMGWLSYNNGIWKKDKHFPYTSFSELSGKMKNESEEWKNKIQNILNSVQNDNIKREIYLPYAKNADLYYRNVIKYQNNSKINGVVEQASHQMIALIEEFDTNPYDLNTPSGIVDLKTGNIRPHQPKERFTRMTSVSPLDNHSDWQKDIMFTDFLSRITSNDKSISKYLQICVGSSLIGKVFNDSLYILFGNGGNGKSTFINSILKVAGSYAKNAPDSLLKYNQRPFDSATLKGIRIALISELDDSNPISGANIKRYFSVDKIVGEEKYKDSFEFEPTHHGFVTTNHLPTISLYDKAIADRIRIIPFLARIRDSESDIKDYCSKLVESSGGAILSWMIEGAKQFIEDDYKIDIPDIIKDYSFSIATDADNLDDFISNFCITGDNISVSSSILYDFYVKNCSDGNILNQKVFKQRMREKGYIDKRTNAGIIFKGINLCNEYLSQSDESI